MKIIVNLTRIAMSLASAFLLQGCVTAKIDEMTYNRPEAGVGASSVVLLGRRHASDYDTEKDFVQCVRQHIQRRDETIGIIQEAAFLDELYPWFEPRTAPMHPSAIKDLLGQPAVANKLKELDAQYMIWIDGNTERVDAAGSMTCGVGPTGAGCFGFGTWSDASNYEAVIWDFSNLAEVGRINTSTSGQSYMPAVVIRIPMLAPLQGTACDGIGEQLLQFLSASY
jgi:hypothetical protein